MPLTPEGVRELIARWGVLGPMVFTGMFALRPFVFFPSTLLFLAGGLAFGVGWGTLYSAVGATIGGVIGFAIALAAFLGPSLSNAMIAIGISATPVFVRLTRGTALAVKAEDFVLAARAIGNSPLRIAVRHVLPNIVPPLLVQVGEP